MAKVPRTVDVPQLDPATGAEVGVETQEVVNPETGEVEYDEIPLGDVNTAIVEPYRLAIDPIAQDLFNARWVMEYAIQPVSWIKEMYDRDEEGYTGEAKEVTPEKHLSTALRRFYELKTSTGIQTSTAGFPGSRGGGSDEMIENAAVLKEYYERPSQQHPKGRRIVVANSKVLYIGSTDSEGTELGDWHPYSEMRWETVPGRFWGKSPLDPATEINKRINSIDSAIILVRKTMAVPQKLVPKGSGIKQGDWTGRPGQIIEYRSGETPTTVPSAGVDPQVFEERKQMVQAIKDITGAVDILKGDRPPGVTAASAMELLFEVATGKLRPVLDRWKKFVESSQKKQLQLVARKYKEPRDEFIKMMAAKNKDVPPELINSFIGTDLYDNCNVTIEAGSNVPKLQSARKAQLLEAAQTGALQLELPENRSKFLDSLGILGFAEDVDPDKKRAEWENDLLNNITRTPDKPAIVLDVDNHQIHIDVHQRRMKEPSFMSMPFEAQQAYMQHVEQHEQKIAEKQQMAQMEAMSSGMPPAPEPDPNAPVNLENRGSGVDEDIANQALGMSNADIPAR
jgi:hypothetical protein